MAINTLQVHDLLANKYNAGASGDDTLFSETFFHALNRVCIDLSSSKVGISVTAPTDLQTNMTIDNDYYGTIIDGLTYYIPEMGFWGQDADTDKKKRDYELSLNRAHTYYNSTQTIYTGIRGA